MHVDLVEALRCTRGHADGWLVVSADHIRDRRIIRGRLGCPDCGAEWEIADGLVDLRSDGDTISALPVADAAMDPSALALRLAALLDLRDARGAVVLTGASAQAADALASITGVLVLAVNAPAGTAGTHSRLLASGALPLGVGTVRGVVLDDAHADAEWMASATRAVERGGRLIAPANVPVPPDVDELARDELEWVGEVRVAASGLVPLRRSGALP